MGKNKDKRPKLEEEKYSTLCSNDDWIFYF